MKIKLLSFLLLTTTISSLSAQPWKTYPYHQPGTLLYFPEDEGRHPAEPMEWWYTNGFLTGQTTGNAYTFMLTYFYNPFLTFDGFRILNIANETTGLFFPETQPCNYPVMSQNNLHINAALPGGVNEEWSTRQDSVGNLIPFEYHLNAQSQNGSIDLVYIAQKRPLIVADSGYLHQGISSYTYYYSLTTLSVQGTITLNGDTETVIGTAWIDRQYGNFNPSTGEKYEWFSLQLSNGMDLNVWNIFTNQNTIPDTSTYRFCSIYINDSTSLSSSDFSIEREQYVFMTGQTRCYAKKWHFVKDSIDLIFTTLHDNQEVTLPFTFYEGSVSITGTVNGTPVTGSGFAELLHNYQHPVINLIAPVNGQTWDGTQPVTWQLLNPDDGRKIYYDVEVSLNDSLHYQAVAQSLTDTTYQWDVSSIPPGSPCWIRIIGYSIDTTLTGNDYAGLSIITGTEEIFTSGQSHFKVYPNPFHNETSIFSEVALKNAQLILNDMTGEKVKEIKNLSGNKITIGNEDLAAGIYFYTIIQNNKMITTGKFTVN